MGGRCKSVSRLASMGSDEPPGREDDEGRTSAKTSAIDVEFWGIDTRWWYAGGEVRGRRCDNAGEEAREG